MGSRPPYQGVGKRKQPSRSLQPMLVDLDLDHVAIRTAIVGPNLFLPEAHAIERLRRQPIAHLRELLRIRERAAQALDLADLAADVVRRADMAERRGVSHAHPVTGLVTRSDGWIAGLHAHRTRRSTSSILRPSSSVVMMPRWISVCVSELIH